MLREVTLSPPLAERSGNTYPFQPSLGAAVMRCCSAAAKYKCWGLAVLLSCGRKEAGMRIGVRGRKKK